jgi:hypothetical protein
MARVQSGVRVQGPPTVGIQCPRAVNVPARTHAIPGVTSHAGLSASGSSQKQKIRVEALCWALTRQRLHKSIAAALVPLGYF